jgi:uncharacterized membrane protein YdjX (TVP38/TMEM64 family)
MKARSRRRTLARIALGALALALLVVLARQAGQWVPRFAAWVDGLGVWGPLVFVLGYAASSVVVPGAILTLAGGAIFGLFEGTLLVFCAAVLGSSLAFFLARRLARGAIERRFADSPRFAAIHRAVGEEGLKIVFLLRLSPVFPFIALNYVLGLSRVRYRDFLLASVGMLPGTLLYVYYGWVAGDVAALAGGAGPQKSAASYALQAVGLLATLAVTALVTRLARRALAQATAEPELVEPAPEEE